ncbi:MAG: DUF3035 domain-containing protein [Alphaproteobacteria bacterium]|nr:DUF3035 domain-containing protein [Alphaproteobacteria bacterium]
MMKKSAHLAVLGLSAILLAGCSGVSESMGFGRHVPDEFSVVDRAPLSLPPVYDLRAPTPGAARPQDETAQKRANQVVFGTAGKAALPAASKTEIALLTQAGAEQAEPQIRTLVDRESAQKALGERHLVEELLWWKNPEGKSVTVDAVAEAERLKEIKEKGESVTTGATPIIEKNKSGWLGL